MTPLGGNCPAGSTAGRRDRYRRLRCEPLEDRRMLSVLFVDDDAAAGGDGTTWSSAFDDLDAALYQAALADDVDAIWIAEGVYKPPTTGGWCSGYGRDAYFFLPDGVTLYGGFEGTETTLEERDDDPKTHETVLSGDIGMPNDAWDNVFTVVHCHPLVTAGLDGLTITGGYDVRSSGSSHPGQDDEGAGIWSNGALTVSNCTITENTAETGGGIWNAGTMQLINSTVEGNAAVIEGGGIFNEGTLEIEGSTISSNESGSDGGGISNVCGDLLITDSTVSGNMIRGYIDSMPNRGAGVYNEGGLSVRDSRILRNLINAPAIGQGNYGGGLANVGAAEVVNTLVMGNHIAGTGTDQGAGIWNAETGELSLTNATVTYNVYDHDLFGEIANDGELTLRNSIVYSQLYGELGGCGTLTMSNSLIGIDPSFADPYAGDFRLTEASPALDIGNTAFVDGSLSADGYPAVETDLDGGPRVYGESVDAGEYEFQADPPGGRESPSTRVTTSEDTFDPYDGAISLREALWYAEDDPETTITFDEELSRFHYRLTCSSLIIDRSLTIDASSLEDCQIDAGGDSRALLILGGEEYEVTLKGVTVRGGAASHGGGIFNTATLTLDNSAVEGNCAQEGGGVFNVGTLLARGSLFGGNDALWSGGRGGAIYNAGTVELVDVVFETNDAWHGEGGAVYNFGTTSLVNGTVRRCKAADGGAVFSTGTLDVANSTFIICNAIDGGGAVNIESGRAVLRNSTITASEAQRGGGVFISDFADVRIENTILARNAATEQGPDLVAADGVLSGSHNLVGDGSGQTAFANGVDGNLVGTADAPLDPAFVRDPAPGSDWGDLSLRWTSPAIDAGDNLLLPADTYDIDGDGNTGEQLPLDLDERDRVYNNTVDIGAYEFHFRDSDLNGDGKVDSEDLGIVRSNWGQIVQPGVVGMGDPSGDGLVGAADLDIVRAGWGCEPAAAAKTTRVVLPAKPGRAAQAAATDAALVATVAERPHAGLSDSDLASLAQAAWMHELQSRENRANKRAVATVIPVWRTT